MVINSRAMNPRRFTVALSFPGEHREFVSNVADHLASTFGEERVLYDKYHDAEFARVDLDVYLPDLYRAQSELVVVFLCAEYAAKRWCNLEWRYIRQLIATLEAERIMLLSFGNPGDLSELGILPGDGYIDIGTQSIAVMAEKILKRLRLNQGTTPPASHPVPLPATAVRCRAQLWPIANTKRGAKPKRSWASARRRPSRRHNKVNSICFSLGQAIDIPACSLLRLSDAHGR